MHIFLFLIFQQGTSRERCSEDSDGTSFSSKDAASHNFSIIEGLEVVQETPALSDLLLYYKSTWIDGNFPPKLWNVHSSSMRTNNMVEGWHSKLNKRLRKSHPNIYELINYLKKEQGKTELTISQTRLGAPAPKRKKKYRQLEERIQSLTTQHKEGQEFLSSIRNVVHEF